MHAGGHSFAYKEFVETAEEDGIQVRMKYPVHKGDRFEYRQKSSEIVSAAD